MKSVVQRVSHASVSVGERLVGSISYGLLVYLGVEQGDTDQDLEYLVNKIPRIRLFQDDNGKMNLSLADIKAEILVVSQFTLCADMRKGNRPSFDPAAKPDVANAMYLRFVDSLRAQGFTVATGEFGASMRVSYTNEGPVTFLVESPE